MVYPRIRSNIITGVLAAMMLLAGLVLGSWRRACAGAACPSTASLVDKGYDPQQASKVYAADGRLITDLGPAAPDPGSAEPDLTSRGGRLRGHRGQALLRSPRGRLVPFLRCAHGRISGMAAWPQGFSTITMQLARNLFPEDISGQDRTIRRKLREVQVAYDIERNFPRTRFSSSI